MISITIQYQKISKRFRFCSIKYQMPNYKSSFTSIKHKVLQIINKSMIYVIIYAINNNISICSHAYVKCFQPFSIKFLKTYIK